MPTWKQNGQLPLQFKTPQWPPASHPSALGSAASLRPLLPQPSPVSALHPQLYRDKPVAWSEVCLGGMADIFWAHPGGIRSEQRPPVGRSPCGSPCDPNVSNHQLVTWTPSCCSASHMSWWHMRCRTHPFKLFYLCALQRAPPVTLHQKATMRFADDCTEGGDDGGCLGALLATWMTD